MPRDSTLAHLQALYRASDDPWQHRTSSYEQAKFAETVRATGGGPFRAGLEIGCGNGTLSRLLAALCEKLTAIDCIPAAIAAAGQALRGMPNVEVILGIVPDDLPAISPDLVVLSEVLYFLEPSEVVGLADWIAANVQGTVVCVNWTGPTDEPMSGEQAVSLFLGLLKMDPETIRHEKYRIDVVRIQRGCARPVWT